MFLLNLKDCYPEIYTEDQFILVSNEVYKLYDRLEKDKKNAQRNTRRRPKNIPLEDSYDVEIHLVTAPPPLFELVQMNLASEALHEAISKLSKKQARRIYEYYFFGYSKTEIAKMEGVNKVQITKSIQKAIQSLQKYLKNKDNF